MAAALAARRRAPSRSASPATAARSTSAPPPPRAPARSAPTTTRPRCVETDFLTRAARSCRAAPGGALRHPVRARRCSQLARFAAEHGQGRARPARAPTSRTAATGATRPRRCCGVARLFPAALAPARRGRRPRPPARRARQARRPLLGGNAATASGCCGSSRSPTPGARPRSLGGGGAEAAAERRRAGQARCSADVAGRDLLEQALYLDTRMFLPDGILICNDKMSMAAGLELRVPFLDVELMRFVERIPAACACARGSGKRLHRMAMERLLPSEVALRPKHGFATPYDDWLRALARRGGRAPLRARRRRSAASSTRRPCGGWSDEHGRGRADHKTHPLLPAGAVASGIASSSKELFPNRWPRPAPHERSRQGVAAEARQPAARGFLHRLDPDRGAARGDRRRSRR